MGEVIRCCGLWYYAAAEARGQVLQQADRTGCTAQVSELVGQALCCLITAWRRCGLRGWGYGCGCWCCLPSSGRGGKAAPAQRCFEWGFLKQRASDGSFETLWWQKPNPPMAVPGAESDTFFSSLICLLYLPSKVALLCGRCCSQGQLWQWCCCSATEPELYGHQNQFDVICFCECLDWHWSLLIMHQLLFSQGLLSRWQAYDNPISQMR